MINTARFASFTAVVVICLLSHGLPAAQVSLWSFDGHVRDTGGSGNHASWVGSPTFTDGFDGRERGALLLDGRTEYLLVAQHAGLPIYNGENYSVAFWVRGGAQRNARVFAEGFSRNNVAQFSVGPDPTGATGRVAVFLWDDTGRRVLRDPSGLDHVLSEGTAFDGTWHTETCSGTLASHGFA